ncbi:MAG: DUF4918 domain-containing protein [Sulfurimonas sp.]|nr:MAG: DUF4918 domain-containing protein [Sulfurimonas sp.]
MTLNKQILDFYFSMPKDLLLPDGIDLIYPYENVETQRVMKLFYKKYYEDTLPRGFLLGINPGRLGAGITGIGFSDALCLEKFCDIPNSFDKRSEPSATFIYEVIEAYGGTEKFYKDFYITAVMPMGLLKEKKNYNYYDDKQTLASLDSFIKESIQKQLDFGSYLRDAVCIGQGKNLKYLQSYNEKYEIFDTIYTVPHPRWVMQYKRKDKHKHIDTYLRTFEKVLKK